MSVYRTIGPLVIDLVAKHMSGELRCSAPALIDIKLTCAKQIFFHFML